ncbi:hypothetical protein [Pedobacter cryophilus]|uniref:Uncharacterized protein n=1 Tax=Pedobacter cryophilus TaxID=2571271 RepID=A0A4U1BW09_9SPHI|nr:hypothetical protein [Pedobacter cryophilus]TKB97039.1 hypothetical protein FA046_13300 [Pedobacter cryophilus]
MDFVTPAWGFKLLVLSAIVIFLIATIIVLAKKDVSLFKRVFLLVLTWLLPIIGGLSAILIVVLPNWRKSSGREKRG